MKNYFETNINLFDKKSKLLKEGELVLLSSYCPIWNTQLFINLALEIAKTTQTQFFSCKYDEETIYRFFGTAIENFDLEEKRRNFSEKEQKKVKSDLNNLKLNLFASKFLTYNKIWHEHISKTEIANVLFIDNIDYLYFKKGWDLERSLKKLAKHAINTNVCIIINATLPSPKKIDPNDLRQLYKLSLLKKMEMQIAYFDKILTLHRDDFFGKMEDYDGKSTIGIMEINMLFSRDDTYAQFIGHVGTTWKIDFENFY